MHAPWYIRIVGAGYNGIFCRFILRLFVILRALDAVHVPALAIWDMLLYVL